MQPSTRLKVQKWLRQLRINTRVIQNQDSHKKTEFSHRFLVQNEISCMTDFDFSVCEGKSKAKSVIIARKVGAEK
jgi:hypothetical protein